MKLKHLAIAHIKSKISQLDEHLRYLDERIGYLLKDIHGRLMTAEPRISNKNATDKASYMLPSRPVTSSVGGKMWYLVKFAVPGYDRGEGGSVVDLVDKNGKPIYWLSIAVPADHPILGEMQDLVNDVLETEKHRNKTIEDIEKLEAAQEHMSVLDDHDEHYEKKQPKKRATKDIA